MRTIARSHSLSRLDQIDKSSDSSGRGRSGAGRWRRLIVSTFHRVRVITASPNISIRSEADPAELVSVDPTYLQSVSRYAEPKWSGDITYK